LSDFWQSPFDGGGQIVLDKPRYWRTGKGFIAPGNGWWKL
jgi:hypothetical protein